MTFQIEHTSPILDVLIPVRDAEKWLPASIESILDQRIPNWQLLIADNGSRDSSVAVARQYADMDHRVKVFECPGMILADVRNFLVQHSRSDFIAWLDSDYVAEPNRLELKLEFLRKHNDCVLVGSDVLVIDPDGDVLKTEETRSTHDLIMAELLERKSKGLFFPSCTGRRSAFIEAGGFRNQFRCAEDIDLFFRLAELGKLANINVPLIRYRWRPDNLSWSRAAEQQEEVRLAVNEARSKRNLPPLERSSSSTANPDRGKAWFLYASWANTALHAGNFRTAKKYSFKTLSRNPFRSKSWRCLALALFPLDGTAHRSGTRNPVARFLASLGRRSLLAVASLCELFSRREQSRDAKR